MLVVDLRDSVALCMLPQGMMGMMGMGGMGMMGMGGMDGGGAPFSACVRAFRKASLHDAMLHRLISSVL